MQTLDLLMQHRLMLVLLFCGVLGGCGGQNDAGEGERRLEIWTLALSPYFDDYITGLVEGFEAASGGGS